MNCPHCKGSGIHPNPSEEDIVWASKVHEPVKCPECNGSGKEEE